MLKDRHRSPGRIRATGLVALFGLLTIPLAYATTLRRMDLPELIVSASRIVHARAVDSSVGWDDEGLRIYTDTTFEVLAEAKGSGPSTLTLRLLGGRIDPVEMTVAGSPSFVPGDEVVLFVLDRPDGKSDLAGFTQGVMRVSEETDTAPGGEITLRRVATSEVPLGVTVVDLAGQHPEVVRPSPLRAPLDRLLDEIRGIVAGMRPPGPVFPKEPEPISAEEEVNP